MLVHNSAHLDVGGTYVLCNAHLCLAAHIFVPEFEGAIIDFGLLPHSVHLDVDHVVAEKALQVQVSQLLYSNLGCQVARTQVY